MEKVLRKSAEFWFRNVVKQSERVSKHVKWWNHEGIENLIIQIWKGEEKTVLCLLLPRFVLQWFHPLRKLKKPTIEVVLGTYFWIGCEGW